MTISQNPQAPQQGRHHQPATPPAPGPATGQHQRPSGTARPSGPYPMYSERPVHLGQPVRPAGPVGRPGYAAQPSGIPAQWGPTPAGAFQYPHPAPAGPAVAAAPRNGLGIAALCLGIVGMVFGLVPFTGFLAFILGAIGIILGLVGFSRARRRIATNTKTALAGAITSLIAIALGIWGMVIVFTGLNQLSQDLSTIPSTTSPAGSGTSVPADVATPATLPAPRSFQLEVTGTAKKMMVGYGVNNATTSTPDYQKLPWRKTVQATADSPYSSPYASVTATSSGPGSITCTITDTSTGAVVATQTSNSLDDSEYGSANVSCSTMG